MFSQYPVSRRTLMQGGLKGGAALGLGAFTTWPARAEINTLNDAINKAGRQRMLSQRMAKAWLAMGQGIDAQQAEKIMLDSMALFDRQFVELKAYAPSPEIRATYLAMEPVWSNYKGALIGSTPERGSAAALLALDAQVLKLGAEQQWVFFDQALSRLGEGSGGVRRARDVFSTSEQILQIMDRVTGLYSRLA